MLALYKRFQALKKVNLSNSNIQMAKSSELEILGTGKIVANNSNFWIGFPLPNSVEYASNSKTRIIVEDGATIVADGDVFISSGVTVRVKKGALLYFGGRNCIAHNTIIFCSRKIEMLQNVAISWNCTLMDEDGHVMLTSEGKPIRSIYRPLIVGANAGIQMGVIIPKGVTIGENAIVAAGTILRQDVPRDSLAFTETKLKVKHGYTTPFRK